MDGSQRRGAPRGKGGKGRGAATTSSGACGERRRSGSGGSALSAGADVIHFPRNASFVDLSALVRDGLALAAPSVKACSAAACQAEAAGGGGSATLGRKVVVARIDVGPAAEIVVSAGGVGGVGPVTAGGSSAGGSAKRQAGKAAGVAAADSGPWAALAALRNKVPQ